jgi:hypothetical protein
MAQPLNSEKVIHESKPSSSPVSSVRATGARSTPRGESPKRRGALRTLRAGAH